MVKRGIEKFIPDYYYESIFDIDFLKFYDEGIRFILLDIDNTIAKYTEKDPSAEIKELIKKFDEIGFEVIIISNNYKKRIKTYCEPLNLKFVNYALKPLKLGYKRALKIASRKYKRKEILAIGDQLMTDVNGANKMGFYSLLVNPLERKTDVFTTKLNRFFEKRKIKQIKKKYPELYETKIKNYENM